MHKAALGGFLARNPFPGAFTDGLFYREKMRAIHRVAPDELRADGRAPRVLDVGGGRSGLAALLYPGAEIVSLDIDPALSGQGPAAHRAAFVCGDACRLPFADGAFDAGSMGPNVEAATRFALATGKDARIGRIEDATDIVLGKLGTIIQATDTGTEFRNRPATVGQSAPPRR